MNILVVDDEAAIRKSLDIFLRLRAHAVLEAEDGAGALNVLAGEPVDLIITDIRMPVLDGLGLLEQVRARFPAVATIIITGYADTEEALAAVRLGVVGFLRKPCDLLELHLLVERVRQQREVKRIAVPSPADRKRRRDILIVEDEPEILNLLLVVLQNETDNIDAAADCAAARALLAANHHAILLTDVRLPDGNGLDLVTEYLRANPGGQALVMSAHNNEETAREALRRGAKEHYAKPFRDLIGFRREIGVILRDGESANGPASHE